MKAKTSITRTDWAIRKRSKNLRTTSLRIKYVECQVLTWTSSSTKPSTTPSALRCSTPSCAYCTRNFPAPRTSTDSGSSSESSRLTSSTPHLWDRLHHPTWSEASLPATRAKHKDSCLRRETPHAAWALTWEFVPPKRPAWSQVVLDSRRSSRLALSECSFRTRHLGLGHSVGKDPHLLAGTYQL